MSKFVDQNGLLYFWQKLKSLLLAKVDKVDGKGLSTNDYTTAEKNKLSGVAAGANAYAHPTYTARAAGLYKVTVDAQGHVSAVEAVAKEDITALGIPATNTTYGAATSDAAGLMAAADKQKLDAFSAASDYALKSDITGLYRYKGSVATADKLPATGNALGDVYDVQTNGTNYAWNGTAWDGLGGTFAIDAVSNAEIDAVLAS